MSSFKIDDFLNPWCVNYHKRLTWLGLIKCVLKAAFSVCTWYKFEEGKGIGSDLLDML